MTGEEQDQESTEPTEIDLASSEIPSAPALSPTALPVEQRREEFRGLIAQSLLALIGATLFGAFVLLVVHAAAPEDVKDLLTATLGPLIGLLGAVVGFYYGSQDRK